MPPPKVRRFFVFCGSALNNIGGTPGYGFYRRLHGSTSCPNGPGYVREPLAALVFKTIADPYIGRLNFFKVIQGEIKADSVVYNATKERDEKIGQILVMRGKEQQAVPEAKNGDIVAVAKLAVTATGDTLTVKANPIKLEEIVFPEPTLGTAIEPKSREMKTS